MKAIFKEIILQNEIFARKEQSLGTETEAATGGALRRKVFLKIF